MPANSFNEAINAVYSSFYCDSTQTLFRIPKTVISVRKNCCANYSSCIDMAFLFRRFNVFISNSSLYNPFLSARKESRYREPPPTPPGYTALSISDLGDGHQQAPAVPTSTVTHTGRRPPDYTTALQRSRMVTQSPDSHKAHQRLQRTRSPAEDQEGEEEEEGESMSSKVVALRKAKPVAQHTAGSPRP